MNAIKCAYLRRNSKLSNANAEQTTQLRRKQTNISAGRGNQAERSIAAVRLRDHVSVGTHTPPGQIQSATHLANIIETHKGSTYCSPPVSSKKITVTEAAHGKRAERSNNARNEQTTIGGSETEGARQARANRTRTRRSKSDEILQRHRDLRISKPTGERNPATNFQLTAGLTGESSDAAEHGCGADHAVQPSQQTLDTSETNKQIAGSEGGSV